MTAQPLGGRRRVPLGWSLVTLNDIKSEDHDACRSGPFGSSIGRKYFVEAGVPVIRGNNLSTDLTPFSAEGFVFVTEQRAREKYKNCIARPGDLVFTCWGTIGQIGLIPDNGPFERYVISNKQLKLRTDPAIANSRFVYYYVASDAGVEYIRSRSIGSAVPGINLGILKSIPLALPPMVTQESIVSILSAYDDLIENNRRRIVLLEQAARLLYKEWFVHLRFPGHEHVAVVDGVPEGWRVRLLSDLATKIGSGATPRGGAAAYQSEGTTLIRSQNVYDYRFEDDGLAHINDDQAEKLQGVTVEPLDILLNITGASVGRCCIVLERHLPARVNQHVMIIRIDPDECGPQYVLHSINSHQQKQKLLSVARAGGATREALTKDVVQRISVVVPTRLLQEQFEEIAGRLFAQGQLLTAQNSQLAKARDLLLPRLMNGEVTA